MSDTEQDKPEGQDPKAEGQDTASGAASQDPSAENADQGGQPDPAARQTLSAEGEPMMGGTAGPAKPEETPLKDASPAQEGGAPYAPPPVEQSTGLPAGQTEPVPEVPVAQRVQVGVPYQEGEQVYQQGTEAEPAQELDQSLQTVPVKAEHELPPDAPPGKQSPGPV